MSVWAAGLGIVLGLAAHTSPAGAHDVWLRPSTFRPGPGESVAIEVVVGEGFRGEAVPRRPQRIRDFWIGGGGWREPVRGIDGAAPAGLVRLAPGAHGWYVVRYVSHPASLELPPERFAEHLRREGLDGVLRDAGGEVVAGGVVSESYARCAGALLEVGAGGALPAAPRDCELVLWPRRLETGDGEHRLELALTLNGDPVADAGVRALLEADPSVRLAVRTDERGRAELDLPRSGVWLVKAIHLERSEGAEVDWRSWWASLTFEVGAR